MIELHDIDGCEALRRRHRLDPIHLKRVRGAFYKNRKTAADALELLPDEVRDAFAGELKFHHLELASRHDSELDGASKLVFETHDGLRIETVILRVQTGRTALCVSSQVGCGADCAFCATGKLGLRRNLTSGEILDQIVQSDALLADEDRRVRNIVFMGMGEPFHNEPALHETLAALEHKELFHRSLAQVSVSTVGIPDAMRRCAERFPRARIALSLHSARQEVREQIIPLAKRYSLDDLRDAIAFLNDRQDGLVMLEHLMLDGLTDRDEDLEALAAWADGLAVHINLIPFNPVNGAPFASTPQPRREAFANELKARGFPVTLRYSLGADVTAACGQLVRDENRRAPR